jgi:O-acetyl-ADP-ribose deacetylase (regulator of RNase III)
MAVIESIRGDLTLEAVDAVVNAAGEDMTRAGGGGVEKALLLAGGPGLVADTKALGKLCVGEARATDGHDLLARYVIHVATPRWRGGQDGEAEDLALCHREAVRTAYELGLKSLAFPALSTGIFGYPVELAAPIAIGATRQALELYPLELVRFVLFSEQAAGVYRRALRA